VRGYYQRTSDLRISTTDPDATPMRLKGGGTHLDNHPMLDLLWHTCFRWHLWPDQITADSLYGT
jgi:hypothetical protein